MKGSIRAGYKLIFPKKGNNRYSNKKEPKMEEKINNNKLYELVLNCKVETEKNRDEINKYYTSLFTALVSLAPFLDKFTSTVELIGK